jgi:AGZA family xanthine/uracil permease-like MFS transporter
MSALERFFRLKEHGTNVRTELLAGLTTFLTMAYIIFVNPSILGDAGMPKDAVFVATCLAAAIGSLVMGLYANWPIALAPGMGLNAYFAYGVVKGMGYTWEAALGAVFISGCLFLLISLFRIREIIIRGIPHSIRTAITAGIGLFLGIIALKNAGIVAAHPATLVTLGDLHKAPVILAIAGFFLIVALDHMRVRGAILIGIVAVTVLSFLFAGNQFGGIVSAPPSIAPTLLKLDIAGALSFGLLNVVLVFFLVELFDATGTLMGVAKRAGLLAADAGRPDGAQSMTGAAAPPAGTAPAIGGNGKPDRLNKALLADSTAIVAGAGLGTSSTTAYIESASGVEAGGRTGLTAVVVALLFLACLFIAPLAGAVPAYATAPALFFVSCLMLRELADIDWSDVTESVPAVITALMMPFTYSIANGIAFGFISYAGLKLFTGRAKDVPLVAWIIAAIFVFRYVYLGAE